ncbi:MarC family protein [Synechococcus elongatus]|uniref:MarC family protein n=1 Tax=Synechococcus elongatus TaxID=32046 RepID=UPI000F7EED92|nr:MarC family protein [Synechococcus elongatus]
MSFPSQAAFATTLFAMLNPLGMLPVFISYTESERRQVQRWAAFFISLTVFGLLILFLLTGSTLLRFFGITLSSFRIAGGILLLLLGINLTIGNAAKQAKVIVKQEQENSLRAAESVYKKIVIPLAVPLLVGPGAIANVILHGTLAETEQQYGLLAEFALIIALMSLLTFIIFQSGRWFQKVIGDVGLSILTRILGLLVAAIGIQFLVAGVADVAATVVTPAVLQQLQRSPMP